MPGLAGSYVSVVMQKNKAGCNNDLTEGCHGDPIHIQEAERSFTAQVPKLHFSDQDTGLITRAAQGVSDASDAVGLHHRVLRSPRPHR